MTSLRERRVADFRHGRPPSAPEPVMERLAAEAEHRQAVAEFRARRRAGEQARIGALLTEVVAALAHLLDEDPACEKCAGCMRALSPRRRTCPHCGTPVSPAQSAARLAALSRAVRDEAA